MNANNAIEVRDLTKRFKVYMDKGNSLKEKMVQIGRNRYEVRNVLNGISFDVKKGEAIGLIGHNGCGKSTTLKLLSKISYPTSGTVAMCGRVSCLIELGAGFHPDMSGRENIYTNASIFGLKRQEIEERMAQIIEFSELEEFIDNPVRTYSSGMYMRLAFAVAINVDADILLIDEILAVGDARFQEKCFNKIKELKANGTTIVIVSHSLGQIEEICERTIWIHEGKIHMEGAPKDVHPAYMKFMNIGSGIGQNEESEDVFVAEDLVNCFRVGDAKLNTVKATDTNGNEHILFDAKQMNSFDKISIDYSIDKIADTANVTLTKADDKWYQCESTDLNNPAEKKEFVIRKADVQSAMACLGMDQSDILPSMSVNADCVKKANSILISQNGLMWGPYVNVMPMKYKLEVDATFNTEASIWVSITAENGQKQVNKFELLNGLQEYEIEFEEKLNRVEFVIHNTENTNILINSMKLI